MKKIELNPYKNVWAIIEPIKGIVTKHDAEKMKANRSCDKKVAIKFFSTKEDLMTWAKMQDVKKGYRVRYCYDKQNEIAAYLGGVKHIEFTKKQIEEVSYIGKK